MASDEHANDLTSFLHSGNPSKQYQPADKAQGDQQGSQAQVSLVPVGTQVGHHDGDKMLRLAVSAAQQNTTQ